MHQHTGAHRRAPVLFPIVRAAREIKPFGDLEGPSTKVLVIFLERGYHLLPEKEAHESKRRDVVTGPQSVYSVRAKREQPYGKRISPLTSSGGASDRCSCFSRAGSRPEYRVDDSPRNSVRRSKPHH